MSWQHGLFLRVLCLGAGYLFGCFLTAEIVARCTAGCSAREIGTGNPGMANILTHLGKPAGFLVLAGDVLKTAAACWFCWQAAPELGHTALLYGGLGAVLGHNWPFWNKFRGGKGVAVSCTWLILYLPITGALCCLAGGGAVLLSGYLPLGRADRSTGRAGGLAAIRRRERFYHGSKRLHHADAALGRFTADAPGRGAAVFSQMALLV